MQTVDLQSIGLVTHANPLALPPGALLQGKNATIDQPNLTETQRGSKVVATFLDQIRKEFVFKKALLIHHGSSLAYDTGGFNFVDYADPVNGPDYPIYATTANQNFYFTTDTGVRKLDLLSNQPVFAGVPQGLGGPLALIASVGAILPNNQQIAYRIVWGYKDGNNNTILGAPSSRMVIANTSGGAQDIEVTAYIPDLIVTQNYFYQLYRSIPTATTIAPLDEMYLVDEVTLTPTDLINRFITYTDHKENTGATIYTAPSQQGIQNSNYQPPLCKDITTYNQMNVYANIQTLQFVELTLSKSLDDGFGYVDILGDTTSGSTDLTSLVNVDNVRIGQQVEHTTDITPGTLVTNVVPPTTVNMDTAAIGSSVATSIRFMDRVIVGGEVYLGYDSNVFADGKFEVTSSIEETCINLCNAINFLSTTYSAYYLGIGTTDIGKIVIKANNFNSAFTVTSSYSGAFVNNMPTTSTNDAFPHGLVVSKPNQPESVPLSTLYRLGSQEFEIQRVLALEDGLYVFKADGTWRGVGFDPVNLVFRNIDNTTTIKGAATAVVFDGNIILHTDSGVSACNQGGITPISGPIKLTLQKLQGTTFDAVSFGVAYESDNKYYLYCNTDADDTEATQAFIYNSFTKTWTQQSMKPLTAAIVSYADDKMYLGNLTRLRQERKDYEFTDFVLDEVNVNVQSFSGTQVTIVSVVGVNVGWFLSQNEGNSEIMAINGNVLTLKSEIEVLTVGPAIVGEPIETVLQWIVTAGNPATYKHFQDFISLHAGSKFEDLRCTFATDLYCPNESVQVLPETEGEFGDCGFGEDEFGIITQPPQPIHTYVPLEQARAPWLTITLTLSQAYGKLSIAGQSVVLEPMDTRYR